MNDKKVLRICVATLGWDFVFYKFKTFFLKNKISIPYKNNTIPKSVKVSRNKVSGIHAGGVVILTLLYKLCNNYNRKQMIISLLEPFTLGYFVFDSIQNIIILRKKFDLTSLGYLIHHILVSFAVLYSNRVKSVQNGVYTILGLGEISNLPSYVMYHLIHKNKKNTRLGRSVLTYQTVHYTLIRLFILPYFFLNNKNRTDLMNLPFWVIYMMGVYWSRLLWTQLLHIKNYAAPSLNNLQQYPHTF